MTTGRLSKARLNRLHDVLAGYVDRGEIPGLVTLVSRRSAVHVDAIGMKAFGSKDPMRRDEIFRISSTMLAEILRARPGIRGTLVDLPRTVAPSAEIFQAASVADRVTAARQSFFDPLPTGADL